MKGFEKMAQKKYDYLKANRWISKIHKLYYKLERLEVTMPELLTKADKGEAQIELDHLFLLVNRLEVKVKNATEVDKSEI